MISFGLRTLQNMAIRLKTKINPEPNALLGTLQSLHDHLLYQRKVVEDNLPDQAILMSTVANRLRSELVHRLQYTGPSQKAKGDSEEFDLRTSNLRGMTSMLLSKIVATIPLAAPIKKYQTCDGEHVQKCQQEAIDQWRVEEKTFSRLFDSHGSAGEGSQIIQSVWPHVVAAAVDTYWDKNLEEVNQLGLTFANDITDHVRSIADLLIKKVPILNLDETKEQKKHFTDAFNEVDSQFRGLLKKRATILLGMSILDGTKNG